jgi:hypothetical protein
MKQKKQVASSAYEVGYRKPPAHTRFPKGVSGNPTGRPRGITLGRAKELMAKEFFRTLRVKEGDKITELTAVAAITRSFVTAAVKGNGPAQRAAIEMIPQLERDVAEDTMTKKRTLAEMTKPSDLEVARRIAFALERAGRELERQKRIGVIRPG